MSLDWNAALRANNYRAELIKNWREAAKISKLAVETERALRAEVIATYSAHADPNDLHASMENVNLPNGELLKIQHKVDYRLDADGDLVEKQLDLIEKSQEGGNVIAERLVAWKPEISIKEYKLLNAVQKALIDKVLTIKPASKSIEIK
jgi:hypothetical protein